MIHRTRVGNPPDGGPEQGRSIVRIGESYVEYSGVEPSQADLEAYNTPAWWRQRKDLYRERIAEYKSVPDAGHQDVLGFVMDATIKAIGGDTAELSEIAAIVQVVKRDVPKS